MAKKVTSKASGTGMSFIEKMRTSFNDDHTTTLNKIDPFKNEANWVSTGSPSLDYHLNTLGYPTGIIEVRGVSKSGKTTLSLHFMKQAMRSNPNIIVCILSSERRDNKVYAEQIGIRTEDILVHQVITIEDTFNKIQQTITMGIKMWKDEELPGKPNFVFIWDSLGATISSQEKIKMAASAEKDDEDHHKAAMGSAAKAIKRGLRYMAGQIFDNNIKFYIINHSYGTIGSFIPGRKSNGGEAVEYFPSMRLEATYKGHVKIGSGDKEKKVGQLTKVGVVKSDFTSVLETIDIEIGYGLGLVLTEDDLQFGFDAGILEKVGMTGCSFMNGKLKWKNKKELYALYTAKDKFLQILIAKLIKLAHAKVLENRGIIIDEDEN